MALDDRNKMRDYYDALGDAEWDRLEATPRGRVAYQIHRRFLEHYVQVGDHVLEIGAGPGRFTFDLADLGATIVVTDYSQVQLNLHEHRLAGTAAESSVRSRSLLDICDTSIYADATFDAVLAYGGPLSYAFEDAEKALKGLFRITKPGGVVVASVMSTLGSWRFYLPGVLADMELVGDEALGLSFATGDLRHSQSRHVCQMYRSREIVDLVIRCGGEVTAMSASNWCSLGDQDVLLVLEADPVRWKKFLDQEVSACSESGAVDGGTHLLFAARPRLSKSRKPDLASETPLER